jgi:hypothetical protein
VVDRRAGAEYRHRPATVAVTAYDKASSSTFVANRSVPAGGATTFGPLDFAGMQPGFQGSAVVSSDQPIKAIVTLTNRTSAGGQLGIPNGVASGQYQGVDSSMLANTVYFPTTKGGHYGYNTIHYVQNAGSAPATLVATFRMRNNDTHTVNIPNVGPNQMAAFSVLDSPTFNNGQAAGSAGRVGAMSVTAGQPLAGVYAEFLATENPATRVAMTRGFTSNDFDTKAYAPVTKMNRFGHWTGIQVQNVSAGNINITVSYRGNAGACAGQTYTDTRTNVAPNTAATFNQGTGATNLPANCAASATIQATGNIVAQVVELNLAGFSPSLTTYSAFPAHLTTTKISAPLFKDDRFGTRIGLVIQNVGTATTNNIVATFSCTGAATFTAVSHPQTAAVGGAVQFFNPFATQQALFATPFQSKNVNCAVIVTASQPIVSIGTETASVGSPALDDQNHEGFNLVP